MLETAVVFSETGMPFYWHIPMSRTSGSLPDSRQLWDVLWHYRHRLGGVAHTHPWKGYANPSQTDLTTFNAVERGLGKQLVWPVVTFSEVSYYVRKDTEYVSVIPNRYINLGRGWSDVVQELRHQSRGE